jgi:hypothetical protein
VGWDARTLDAPDVVFMARGVSERKGNYVKTRDEAEAAAIGGTKAFDPNQKRDRIGRWTRTGDGLSKIADVLGSLHGKTGEQARQALGNGEAIDTQGANQTPDGKYTSELRNVWRTRLTCDCVDIATMASQSSRLIVM